MVLTCLYLARIGSRDRDAADQSYNPDGNMIAQTGAKADDFKILFSTKYLDEETAWYYYGYRYYSPELGRWTRRDPLGEGIKRSARRSHFRPIEYDFSDLEPNLYRCVQNNPVRLYDPLGLTVQNNCNRPICVKPENGTGAVIIQPGDSYDGEVDGVSDCNGDVHKITDPFNDSDIVVGDDGVNLGGPDFVNNWLGGGKLDCPPDDGWNALFDCAKNNR